MQAEDHFVLKVVQLEELRHVRHSIFVIGNAGTGKSKILRSLNKTYALMGQKPIWVDLNPKAVTTFELFGYINPATRDPNHQLKLNHTCYNCIFGRSLFQHYEGFGLQLQ